MSSLVSEILTSARRGGMNQLKELNECSDKLSVKSEELKRGLYCDLKKEYVEYDTLHEPSLDLLVQMEDRMNEMKDLKEKVENATAQLHLSTQEYSTLKSHLDITKEILSLLNSLARLNDNLKQTRSYLKARNFRSAAETLAQTEKIMQQSAGDAEELKALNVVKTELTVLRELIIYEAQIQWRSSVQFRQTSNETELKIFHDGESQSRMIDVMDALSTYNELGHELKRTSDKLVGALLKPLFKADTNAHLIVDSDEALLTVNLRHDCAPVSVFDRLESVVTFLRALDISLLCLKPTEPRCGGATVASLVRKHLTSSLLDIVLGALDKTLPQTDAQMVREEKFSLTPEAYSAHVATFSEALLQMSLVEEQDHARVESYVSNLPKLCAAKQCQDALTKARALMTTNILDTIVVEGKDSPTFLEGMKLDVTASTTLSETESGVLEALDSNNLRPVLSSPFNMPRCSVSKCIYELMDLALQTYHAGCTSPSDSTGVQLVFSVRKMFELFLDVVPTYHAKLLEELPLAAAIHHNNTMFLAHHITTFGIIFRGRHPAPLKTTKGASAAASLIDLVHPLRKMAGTHFLSMMNSLRTQLMETLKGAKGFVYDPINPTIQDVEKSLRQILFLLNQLAKTWRGVMPNSIYIKAMSVLVNFVVNDITSSILLLEDVGADFAFQLYQLLGTLETRLPRLLKASPPPDDDNSPVDNLFKLLPKWQRFTELRIVLNASLVEINERWADGKGQLAAVFSAFEVKNVIRALFENNEKRARVLRNIQADSH